MWSRQPAPVTRRAAAFCTDCKRRSSPCIVGVPKIRSAVARTLRIDAWQRLFHNVLCYHVEFGRKIFVAVWLCSLGWCAADAHAAGINSDKIAALEPRPFGWEHG